MERRLILQIVIKNMSFQREPNTCRDRVAMTREKVAPLTEQDATIKKKERNLEDAKEKVGIFNRDYWKKADKHGPFYPTL